VGRTSATARSVRAELERHDDAGDDAEPNATPKILSQTLEDQT